jgi:hypothetical protein
MVRGSGGSLGLHGVLIAAALSALTAGCATTQQAKVSEKTEENSCAFLGAAVCAELTPTETPGRFSGAAVTGGGEPAASLRYIDPNAQWTQYKKVLIAPVTFWAGDNTSVSPADQERLTNYFYQAIEKQLSTRFKVVQQPGPGVLTIQVALVDAESATPVLRTISMLIPQARALATLKYLATGTYAFIGSATAELKILDSTTHQVLAAAVDKRVGGGSLSTAAQWQWGDAENAMKAWAQQLTNRLSSWTSGTAPS